MAASKIVGIAEFTAALKRVANISDVKDAMKKSASNLQSRMQDNAVFTKGYSIGETQRSITIKNEDTATTFARAVYPRTNYAPYLEYGTRFMEAQPFIKKSLEQEKEEFKSLIEKAIRK